MSSGGASAGGPAAVVREAVARAGAAPDAAGRAAALRSCGPEVVEALLHAGHAGRAEVVARGVAASPGAATGRVALTAEAALDLFDAGHEVVLVCHATSPADEPAMQVAAGIVTASGGATSHAAVVARGLGVPAVCGADGVVVEDGGFRVGDRLVPAGEVVSLDGGTGEVFLGDVGVLRHEVPAELDRLLGWADEARRGRLRVLANADVADDARRAADAGAEGIGLCRTEHVFLGERLPLVQRLVLAADPAVEQDALEALAAEQRAAARPVLEAMDGRPVTVRLLDAPLHEFLPDVEDLAVRAAAGHLDDQGAALLAAARSWHEHNPMIGTRGVRLAVLRPDVYRAQVRALLGAALDHARAGGSPQLRLMVPLVVDPAELRLARSWVEAELAALGAGADEVGPVPVGTMVETPRAALLAGPLAAEADFFSFGTNDLTQLVFGFSRDDVATRVVAPYVEQGLLDGDPFRTLDPHAVGPLVARAVDEARRADPTLHVGVCGEHGGDPASIATLLAAGVDEVSCSPPRVPVARLAAARAVLDAGPADARPEPGS